jgi:flagellar hook assembly protein FlgD
MQTKRSILAGIATCCLIAATFTACKKDSKDNDSDTTSAQDNSLAEGQYNDVNTMVEASVNVGTSFTFRQATNETGARVEDALGGCVKVTLDTANTTCTLTIDFGTLNCDCPDGRKRRGKILATWNGKYRDKNTVVNVTFDNYFVNDNQIKGTHKTTNLGYNTAQHLVYKIEVDGSIVKAGNGGTIYWKSTREREWVAGSNTAGA